MATAEEVLESGEPVVLFDGVCNLCCGVVKFTLRHDQDRVFRFAPLQSGLGEKLLENFGMDTGSFETFVVVEKGEVYTRSDAALKLLKGIGGGWSLAGRLLGVVPRFLRDWGYRLVARSRYRIFGEKDRCLVPDEDVRERFIDW